MSKTVLQKWMNMSIEHQYPCTQLMETGVLYQNKTSGKVRNRIWRSFYCQWPCV